MTLTSLWLVVTADAICPSLTCRSLLCAALLPLLLSLPVTLAHSLLAMLLWPLPTFGSYKATPDACIGYTACQTFFMQTVLAVVTLQCRMTQDGLPVMAK